MADNGMGPQVSVLTPIYNTHVKYLRECIDSVLAQTFSDFEFIILDNASDAYVADLVASYDDPRIRYFRVDENIGPAGGRNFCIARARGKYLAILDSDDVALPERLAAQVAFMDAHPSVGVLGTFSRTTDGCEFFSDTLPTAGDDICRHLLFCGNMLCHSSVMMRADVLRDNKLEYDPNLFPAEDYALWLDLTGRTEFALLPRVLTLYRFFPTSVSQQNLTRQWRNAVRAQLAAIGRNHNIDIDAADDLAALYAGDTSRAANGIRALDNLVGRLNEQKLPGNMVYDMFRGQFKHICYHTHSFGGLWRLMTCPAAGYYGQGIGWRAFCFITRGIFRHKSNVKKDKE